MIFFLKEHVYIIAWIAGIAGALSFLIKFIESVVALSKFLKNRNSKPLSQIQSEKKSLNKNGLKLCLNLFFIIFLITVLSFLKKEGLLEVSPRKQEFSSWRSKAPVRQVDLRAKYKAEFVTLMKTIEPSDSDISNDLKETITVISKSGIPTDAQQYWLSDQLDGKVVVLRGYLVNVEGGSDPSAGISANNNLAAPFYLNIDESDTQRWMKLPVGSKIRVSTTLKNPLMGGIVGMHAQPLPLEQKK